MFGLLLLGLALRVGFVLSQQPGFYFEDSLDYDLAARSLLETGHFNPRYYRFPLYPVFLAGSYRLFGTDLTAVRVIQAIIGTAMCAFVWLTGRRLFGARAGLLALAGAALFPVHVIMCGVEYPVILGNFLIWVVMWLHAGRDEQGAWRPGPLVLAAGLSALASTLFEGGLVLAAFLLAGLILQRTPARIRLRQLGIVAAVGVLVVLPWFSRIVKHGDYRPVFLKAAMHLPSAPGVDAPLWKGSGMNLLTVKLEGLARNPGWTVNHIWSEFWHFWNPYPDRLVSAEASFRQQLHERDSRMVLNNELVGETPRMLYAIGFCLILITALTGGALLWRKNPRARYLVYWPLFLGICYSPFFTQMRYRIPADPAFILLGVNALDAGLRRLSRSDAPVRDTADPA